MRVLAESDDGRSRYGIQLGVGRCEQPASEMETTLNDYPMKKRFKTNAKCGGCVAKIGEQLNKMAKPEEWSIDLASPEKLLTIDTDEPSEAVVRAVSEAGFKAEPLD